MGCCDTTRRGLGGAATQAHLRCSKWVLHLLVKKNSRVLTLGIFTTEGIKKNNNNNNNQDNVYGAVIMAEPLREFTRFI